MYPLKKFQFYPDKPKETSVSCLGSFKKGYIALSKLDGYNLFICNEGNNIETYSRSWNPLPVSDEIRHEWSKLDMPDNSIINCEWMKYRAGAKESKYEGPECVYILTPYVLNGLFFGHKKYEERKEWVDALGVEEDNLELKETEITAKLLTPAKTENNFLSFFETHKSVIRTEGIVVYNKRGIIYASGSSNIKTDFMLKCKYRKGDDGRTRW